MSFNLEKWAVLAPKNSTGFGRMARDVRKVFGLKTQFVASSVHMENEPLEAGEFLLAKETPKEEALNILSSVPGIEGIMFFETMGWHPNLMEICNKLNIKTACIPMWEWFAGYLPDWKQCDVIICPSRFTENIVHSYKHYNTVYLPWAFDLSKFPKRTIEGRAKLFAHNAGLIDEQDRKGTIDTIRAFQKTKAKDIKLLVRAQNDVDLPKIHDGRIEIFQGSLEKPSDLYAGIDVAIQPSKMEGIGFMVLEPVCSGVPTLTLDYPPMRDYVHQPEMRIRKKWFKRKGLPSKWNKHAHLRLPNIRDLAKKIEWCASHDLKLISQYNRNWAEKMFEPNSLKKTWTDSLSRYFS